MSKIQEALKRIQSNRPKLEQNGVDAEAEITPVAKLGTRSETADRYENFSTSKKTLHVDQKALRDAGLIAPEYHAHLLESQYRKIKRPLIRHAFGKRATKVEDGNLIMVTSALAGEGKTFTSINLALSMAQERDHSVILVDADVAKPHVSRIFGAEHEPGLLDLIDETSDSINSLIMPTDVVGLSILPAGRPRLTLTELLASSRMEKLAHALASITHEPIVIFDSPPLLQTSEASVLASIAGQIVMVVRANHTSQEALKHAINTLGENQAVNLVLNRAQDSSSSDPYGYGYGSAAASNAKLLSDGTGAG